MRSKRGRSQSKFLSYLKVPIRVLARARDLYVQSLTAGGGHVSFGNAMGCPTLQISTNLPRSMSVNSCSSTFRSADEQFRDLIRLGGDHTGNIQPELRRTRRSGGGGDGDMVVSSLPRSKTVVFGRIDEDKAFEFGEDDGVIGLVGEGLVYPMRSRSYAASTRVKLRP